jgi:cysteinyl-tRNA synthetase
MRDALWRIREARCEPGSNPILAEAVRRAARAFEDAMDHDLNTAQALAAVHTLLDEASLAVIQGTLREDDRQQILAWMHRVDQVFGVLGEIEPEALEPELRALIEERARARERRDYARADEIRRLLYERGIILEDTRSGTLWRRRRDRDTVLDTEES